MCNWGTGCHQACSVLPGDSLDHASSICHETNNWERDAVSWDTWDRDSGPAHGSAYTAEPCILLNPVKAMPASCIAVFESGASGERGKRVWKRLFGVQVPLPEAWDGPSTPEMPIWISSASAQPDIPARSWQDNSTIYCCKDQKCCADLLPARPPAALFY